MEIIVGIAQVVIALSAAAAFLVYWRSGKLRHQCPMPRVKGSDIAWYAGRKTVRVAGIKTKVCVWQYCCDATGMDSGGILEVTPGLTAYVRCKDGAIVTPDNSP